MTTALLSNGGPPLDDDLTHTPPWGKNGIGRYFEWAHAKKKAFDAPFDTSTSVSLLMSGSSGA
jgi:hypothetical protein